MKRLILFINKRTKAFGFDIIKLKNAIKGLPFYYKTYFQLKRQKGKDKVFQLKRNYPILSERFETGGTAQGHYFHQDLYVAKKIFETNPAKHVDIGSRVDGFVAHVAVFREIEVFDIRDLPNKIKNIVFKQKDMMNINHTFENYCDSISALHSIEHFGLGRYADPINYNGHLEAIDNIYKILKFRGAFYFSVPIGMQRIEFNAHRVFSLKYLLLLFQGKFEVKDFSYIDDRGDFHESVVLEENQIENNFGCRYGCGVFILEKV